MCVPFAADSEDDGAMLNVSWRGPLWKEQQQRSDL